MLEKTPMQVLQMTAEDLADPALKIISAAWKKEAAAGSLQVRHWMIPPSIIALPPLLLFLTSPPF